MPNARRYLFTGGGTGGHVVPNLAMIAELREQEPDASFYYVGIRGGAEKKLVRDAGIEISFIAARPFASPRRLGAFVVFAFALVVGFLKSLWIIHRRRPHVVVATGGYVSVPVVLAATVLRRPIYLQEQNVRPGKANHLLARFASRIGCSFRETSEALRDYRAVYVGYPVRRRIAAADKAEARARFNIPSDHRVAFIVGGSMGARSINRATVDGLPQLLADEKISIIHSTGLYATEEYHAFEDTRRRLDGSNLPPTMLSRYVVQKYIDRVEDAYAASDLVVARAGAGTVMELAVLGKPAVLIPKLDGADAHQLQNALSLQNAGSAEVLYEEVQEEGVAAISRVKSDELARCIRDLLAKPERLEEMSSRARDFVVPDATKRNVQIVRELANGPAAVEPAKRRLFIGSLESSSGRVQDLVFPISTIGARSSADIVLTSGNVRGLIRRLGSSVDDVEFRLQVRRGEVLVNERVALDGQPLEHGDVLRFGTEEFTFKTRVETIQVAESKRSILKRVVDVGLGTTLSRVMGLAREVVMATAFGTGRVMDVFAASLTVSNLFRRIFAEYAVDAAFLPAYVMLDRQGRRDEARRFFRTALTVSIIATSVVTIAGILTTPFWLPYVVHGFEKKGMTNDTIYLTRWMMPYLILVTVASLMGAVLKAYDRFAATSYSTIMFSVGIIVGSVLYPMFGATALGAGVLLGGLGQVLFHLPSMLSPSFRSKAGISFAPLFAMSEAGMRKLRATAPKIVADVTITKLDTVISMSIVSTLAIGHASVLYFAMLLVQLPFALISQSLNTVVLKDFSESLALRDRDYSRRLIAGGIGWNLFLLLPVSACLIVLGHPIVDLLLHYRNFSDDGVRMVAIAMGCYSLGLVGWGIHGLMGRIYAARLEMGTAMLINLGGTIASIMLSLAFVKAGLSYAGIALGTSLAYLANAGFRVWHLSSRLQSEGVEYGWRDLRTSLGRSFGATLFGSIMAFLALRCIDGFDGLGDIPSRLIVLLVPLCCGAMAYLLAASLLRCPEWDDIRARFTRWMPSSRPRNDDPRLPVNVYCMSPTQLLRVAEAKRVDIPQGLLAKKCEALLKRPDWQSRNIAVKLIGVKSLAAFRYVLCDLVGKKRRAPLWRRMLGGDFDNPGFVRRNAINSLVAIRTVDETIESCLVNALDDGYFEVRAAAARAISVLAPHMSPTATVRAEARLTEMLCERNFEVCMNAVRALQAVAWSDAVLGAFSKLHYHSNWRIRSEVIKAYFDLYKRGVIEDRERILELVDDVLVTCDAFKPTFELKESLRTVRLGLSPATRTTSPAIRSAEEAS